MSRKTSDFSNENVQQFDAPSPLIKAMDSYLSSLSPTEITGSKVYDSINKVFGIDLDFAPVLHPEYADIENPRNAINHYIQQTSVSGASEIRSMIKQLFGINLIGIAELHKDRISLYSKNQWIVKNDTALFHVHTGNKDVDVKILPTPYFTKLTGLTELPVSLQLALSPLGYSYNQKEQALYYRDPQELPVPGDFKVQTMKTIAQIVHQHYADL